MDDALRRRPSVDRCRKRARRKRRPVLDRRTVSPRRSHRAWTERRAAAASRARHRRAIAVHLTAIRPRSVPTTAFRDVCRRTPECQPSRRRTNLHTATSSSRERPSDRRRRTGEDFESKDAKGPHIDGRFQSDARAVCSRSNRFRRCVSALGRQSGERADIRRLGQTDQLPGEICSKPHEMGWIHLAVDDAFSVNAFERFQHLVTTQMGCLC